MEQILAGLALMAIGWFGRQVWDRFRRPRLEVCLDLPESEREFSWKLSHDSPFRGHWTVDLTVRNLGRMPAVNCVARVGSVEVLTDGVWTNIQPRPQGHLSWAESDRTRTVTIRPFSEAPPRHVRFLRFDAQDGSVEVGIRYATPARPADEVPRFDDVPVGSFSYPVPIRLTVWVEPEGKEGRADSCRVTVDWTCSDAEDGTREHSFRLEAEPLCEEKGGRGLFRGLLPSG